MENNKTPARCPKCGGENPQGARFCCSCGCALTQGEAASQSISVRVSRMATIAFIGAVCGLALIMPMLIAIGRPRPRTSEGDRIAFLIGAIVLGVTVILGLVSVIRIERSGGRITGRNFAVGGVLIAVLGLVVLPVWCPVMPRMRSIARRMICGSHLHTIGWGMLVYSFDYDDKLPRSGGRNSIWRATMPNWRASNMSDAYGISADGEGGVGSISSCYYLLIKYTEVTPKSFICSGEPEAEPFEPAKYGKRFRDLIDLWDFGPEPWKHYSYSYHMPFGPYALTRSSDRGTPVAADRNPWMVSPFVKAKKEFSKFDPDGDRKAIRAGNAVGHRGNGQNVLFIDFHVGFEKIAFCGVNDDNIYTYWDDDDIRRGAPPVLGSPPQDRLDSLLVHDPPIKSVK
jgi:hypothetical protein